MVDGACVKLKKCGRWDKGPWIFVYSIPRGWTQLRVSGVRRTRSDLWFGGLPWQHRGRLRVGGWRLETGSQLGYVWPGWEVSWRKGDVKEVEGVGWGDRWNLWCKTRGLGRMADLSVSGWKIVDEVPGTDWRRAGEGREQGAAGDPPRWSPTSLPACSPLLLPLPAKGN